MPTRAGTYGLPRLTSEVSFEDSVAEAGSRGSTNWDLRRSREALHLANTETGDGTLSNQRST